MTTQFENNVARVFSYGGGVQSTAALVLQTQGKLPRDFDAYVFANVGADSENPDTLSYIERYVKPLCLRHGIWFEEAIKRRRDGTQDTVWQNAMKDNRSIPIPIRLKSGAFGNRTCTVDFKIKVIDRWLLDHAMSHVQVGIGFSVDEARRAYIDVCTEQGKVTARGITEVWQRHSVTKKRTFWKARVYPLLDLQLSRRECEKIITSAGLPIPPKLSCFFCPFKKRSEWLQLREKSPELFERAIQLENKLNEKRTLLSLDSVRFHPDGLPLSELPYQMTLWDEYQDTDGTCTEGYCGY